MKVVSIHIRHIRSGKYNVRVIAESLIRPRRVLYEMRGAKLYFAMHGDDKRGGVIEIEMKAQAMTVSLPQRKRGARRAK